MTDNRLEQTESNFIEDTTSHTIKIIKDDGVYRHIAARKPNTIIMGFDIVTWPGRLVYTGDMGHYVFARLPDMFDFHRQPPDKNIPYAYWAEKCEAGDRSGRNDNDGIREFSEELFKEHVEEDFKNWLENHAELIKDNPQFDEEIRERLENEVLSCSNEGYIRACDAALDFEVDGEQILQDFWEHDCYDYTYRFIWCCNAIRWTINQYDSHKKQMDTLRDHILDHNGR